MVDTKDEGVLVNNGVEDDKDVEQNKNNEQTTSGTKKNRKSNQT